MAFLDFLTRPVRGIGRILRGHVRRGLGDLAAGAPLVAALPGIGLPAALAIGAAGGGVERATQPGANIGDIAGGAARGAVAGGVAHGAGNFVRGIGSRIAPTAAVGGWDPTTGLPLEDAVGNVTAPVTGAVARGGNALAEGASTIGRGARAIGRRVLELPGEALRAAKSDPKLALGLLSTGADIYGGYQEGRALDREMALREAEFNRRSTPRMPFDQWDAERRRLRGTYSYGGNN